MMAVRTQSASPAFVRKGLLILATLLLIGLTIWEGWLGASWINRPFNGFFVQPMLYVSPYQHAGWEIGRHGLQPVDLVVSIDGRPMPDTAALVAAARAVPVGTPLRYEVVRGEQTLTVTVPTREFTARDFAEIFGFQATLGWMFLAMAVVLMWVRPALAAARAFALLCVSFGLVFLFYFDFQTTTRLTPLILTGYAGVGASALGVALYFPGRSRWLNRLPWLPRAVAALGLANIAAYHLLLLDVGPAVVDRARYMLGLHSIFATNFVITVGLVAAIGAMVVALVLEPRRSLARRQAGIALGGAVLGLLPVVLWVGPMAFGINSPMPLSLALSLMMLFPVAVAYAIVRAQLFDITVVVRNSLLYGLMSTILLTAYVSAATALRSLLPTEGPLQELIATLVVVALAIPVRDHLQGWIDRTLFRSRYDAQQALEEASRSMTTLLDRDAIISRLQGTVAETLQAEFVEVYLPAAAPDRFAPQIASEAPLLDADSARVRAIAEARNFVVFDDQQVAVPLLFQGRLNGFILIGPRRSELPYTRQDLGLAMTLANQSAIALENASAYARLETFNQELERRVAERTQALEAAQARLVQTTKMSALGELVAGVAHELNNPVTFLVGSIELLDDRLSAFQALCRALNDGASAETLAALRAELGAEDLSDELETLFSACREGAERTQAIVQGLRNFSRLDGFAREPVALRTCIESTVPLIAASFSDDVRLSVEIEEVPPVLGSAIHLKQVVTNLLVNARQALDGHGEVRLTLKPAGDGVELAVHDNGPGIAPEIRDRIFEPFFTTKSSGMGTGLGLSICLGIVEAHEGRLEVDSQTGAGSTFRVRLPALKGASE